MKFLKKANRGFVFLILLILSVVVYIVVCTIQRNDMKSESEIFIHQFINNEKNWRTIPEEYRDDSEGYIKSIENDVRPYFANDDAYNYYVENVIMLQFEKNVFLEEVDIDSIFIEVFSYEDNQATCEIMVNSNTKNSEKTESNIVLPENYFKMRLCQEENGIKIISHDFDIYDFMQ